MALPVMQFNNNKGFTIVEGMIAIVVLSIMMMASIVSLVAIQKKGAENVLRQESVKLGQELVNDIHNADYTAIAAGTTNQVITRHAGGFDIDYAVQRDVQEVIVNTAKSVVFTISWTSATSSAWTGNDNGGTIIPISSQTYIARTLIGR